MYEMYELIPPSTSHSHRKTEQWNGEPSWTNSRSDDAILLGTHGFRGSLPRVPPVWST